MRSLSRAVCAAHALPLVVALLALGGCRDDRDAEPGSATGQSTDRAFAEAGIPTHERTIRIASIGQDRAVNPQLRRLASRIVARRSDEVAQLRALLARVSDAGVPPSGDPLAYLNVDPPDLRTVVDGNGQTSDPVAFGESIDRAFIDAMVAQQSVAILIADAARVQAVAGPTERLAALILRRHRCESQTLNRWRERWHGLPSVYYLGEAADSAALCPKPVPVDEPPASATQGNDLNGAVQPRRGDSPHGSGSATRQR